MQTFVLFQRGNLDFVVALLNLLLPKTRIQMISAAQVQPDQPLLFLGGVLLIKLELL